MNTWFQKKRQHYGSCNRVHTGMRCGSMIDFVVMRSSDHRFCMDTQVMRGASCWSDHYLVRAKLHFGFQKVVSTKTLRKKPLAVHRLVCVSVKDKYQVVLAEKLNNMESNGEVSTGCCWSVMKTSLLAASEEVVGYGGRVQPD